MGIILVTGGCGYLGSRLLVELGEHLSAEGTIIRILDNLQDGYYRALMNLPESGCFQFFEADILNGSALRLALKGVEAVIHLAAVVRTPLSFEHPTWVNQVNHWGTSQLVEACLTQGVKRLIYTSTTSVYGPGGPFSEEDRCHPMGAYAQSKYEAEKVLLAARERGLQSTILRLGTLYGLSPITRFHGVVNKFAYLCGTKRPLTIYGTGDQVRPILHVQDASYLIKLCLDHPEWTVNRILNGVTANLSVSALAKLICEFYPQTELRYVEQDLLTHLSFAVSGESVRHLGWHSRISLEQGLQELIQQFTGLQPMDLWSSY